MIAVDIAGALAGIVAALRAQGIRANVDPTKLNPPCAWVRPAAVAHTRLGGCGELTVEVWLVAADRPPATAHADLGALLTTALEVIDPTAETVTNEAVRLTDSGQPLPGYRMTTTVEI